ncbi:MAG: hypothetical protein JW727_00310 [Candidatus Aenigmarchaeota archaeon]|nr:hypothetical protein [Candidatus Aenigmarchaeota archaeon]
MLTGPIELGNYGHRPEKFKLPGSENSYLHVRGGQAMEMNIGQKETGVVVSRYDSTGKKFGDVVGCVLPAGEDPNNAISALSNALPKPLTQYKVSVLPGPPGSIAGRDVMGSVNALRSVENALLDAGFSYEKQNPGGEGLVGEIIPNKLQPSDFPSADHSEVLVKPGIYTKIEYEPTRKDGSPINHTNINLRYW